MHAQRIFSKWSSFHDNHLATSSNLAKGESNCFPFRCRRSMGVVLLLFFGLFRPMSISLCFPLSAQRRFAVDRMPLIAKVRLLAKLCLDL